APFLLFQSFGDHTDLHSFPTRRSSDLTPQIHYYQTRFQNILCSRFLHGSHPQDLRKNSLLILLHQQFFPLAIYTIILWEHLFFRSEEHTSELQSRENLVCRLLLEKKKI